MFPVRTTPETSSDSSDKVMQSQFSSFSRGKALCGVPKVPPRPLCKVIPTAQRQQPASQNAALPFRHLRTVSSRDNASKTCYTTKNTNDQWRPRPLGSAYYPQKRSCFFHTLPEIGVNSESNANNLTQTERKRAEETKPTSELPRTIRIAQDPLPGEIPRSLVLHLPK